MLHPPYFEHARAAWRVRWGVGARLGWFFGPPMLALGLCVGVCVWGAVRGVWRRCFRLPLVWEVAHIVLRVALWFGVHPCMQYKAVSLCGDWTPTMLGYPQKSGGLWMVRVCGLVCGCFGSVPGLSPPSIQGPSRSVGLAALPGRLGPPKTSPKQRPPKRRWVGQGWGRAGRCHSQLCPAPASPLPPSLWPLSQHGTYSVWGPVQPASCLHHGIGAGQRWGHAWWGVAGWGWLAAVLAAEVCWLKRGGQASQGAAS